MGTARRRSEQPTSRARQALAELTGAGLPVTISVLAGLSLAIHPGRAPRPGHRRPVTAPGTCGADATNTPPKSVSHYPGDSDIDVPASPRCTG